MGLEMVELVLGVEETFCIKITDAEAAEIRTPGQLTDFICQRVNATNDPSSCLTQAAFYEIRRCLLTTTGSLRQSIRPQTQLKKIFHGPQGYQNWIRFKSRLQLKTPKNIQSLSSHIFGPHTLSNIVDQVVTNRATSFHQNHCWTCREVKSVLRILIKEALAIDGFQDNDDFITDLGMG